MAVQITTIPRTTETPAENPELVNGYVAYDATYEVGPNAGTVTHHRRSHVNPELGNLSVVRYFRFSGDTLTLMVAPEKMPLWLIYPALLSGTTSGGFRDLVMRRYAQSYR